MARTTTTTEYALCTMRPDGTWRAIGNTRYESRESAERARADYEERAKYGSFTAYVGSKVMRREVTITVTEWEED